MPTLHELFDTASGDLPPLPDLAPGARRTVRRRQLAARTTAAMLSSALVIGAGTFALAVQRSGNARDTASGPPQAYSQQYVLDTLRSVWPNKDQRLSLEPGSSGIVVSQNGKQVAIIFFEVLADVAKFPQETTCASNDVGCYQTTTSDGDAIIVDTTSAVRYSSSPGKYVYNSPPASVTEIKPTGPELAIATKLDTGARLHGTDWGRLTIIGSTDENAAQTLLAVVESPAYEQLIESAVAASAVGYLGTPPAGIPSDTRTFGPSPSGSGH